MTTENDITNRLQTLKACAPAGFAMALHVRFATPTFLFQAYPKAWSDYYSQNGLVMNDPTVAWGFANTGTCRWSAIDAPDPANVMQAAADHGLKYGVTIALDQNDSRSFASFAHQDAEFSDAEIAAFHDHVAELHDITAKIQDLSPELSRNLKKMAVTVGSEGA